MQVGKCSMNEIVETETSTCRLTTASLDKGCKARVDRLLSDDPTLSDGIVGHVGDECTLPFQSRVEENVADRLDDGRFFSLSHVQALHKGADVHDEFAVVAKHFSDEVVALRANRYGGGISRSAGPFETLDEEALKEL